ncbi:MULTISPECIES: hydroxyphenylacetyl-CoA thioesterase PaaI [Pseudomonas]|jgi:acyl-CoA thioesterase|uniref:Acyl-coenzyme A thioesterase PaaI n=1 Tax=Pseudomonas fluorescens TaxID=294 RepID=A0A5E7GC79_PSEFL|nr:MULTISPECIES: hydroxyphenylacetyl-CoA thioesterase PaaI [Pseudomonas]EJM20431.1 phenylacetic acid degradation protein PaaD [Pseudomonas sp. GM21]MDR7283266.1 acyl-CoA thioesterase [Pseudomonas corrugata]VVO46563.1 Acyl-coenzyme A thioesterase PaaI [Pseudomonas fluorescens]
MTNHEALSMASDCAQSLFNRDTASQAMGMRLLSAAPGSACVGMSVRADMIQGHGTCHGGYLFALADSAFAFACNSYNEATVAIGCSIDYIAPAHLGDTLTADCTEQSRSGRTGNYDVRIENQLGRLIALFHGKSYKVRGAVLPQENPNE